MIQYAETINANSSSVDDILLGSFVKDWHPKEYLQEFYESSTVLSDEVEAIKFQVDFCKRLSGKPLALEFGPGPTVHRAIVVAPYVSEIHVVDYLCKNLEELKRWVYRHEESHNWDRYVSFILQCEGIRHPSVEQIAERENLTRGKITRFIEADAGHMYPLGKDYHERYPFVYSGFCADSATGDKARWAVYMRNIASLVAPGGTFFTAALRKTSCYKSGKHYFPSANIDEYDLQEVLSYDFLPESITIEVKEIPEMMFHGFSGIMLAYANK